MCEECQGLLLDDFVDGLLDAESQAAVAAHLRECSPCAAYAAALRDTRDVLQQAEPITASAQFDGRLRTRLREEDLKREGVKLLVLGLAAVAVFLRLLLGRVRAKGAPTASVPEG
jgi:anti-sigma factor RsiW